MIRKLNVMLFYLLLLFCNAQSMEWQRTAFPGISAPVPPSIFMGPTQNTGSSSSSSTSHNQHTVAIGFDSWVRRSQYQPAQLCSCSVTDILSAALSNLVAHQQSYLQQQVNVFQSQINTITLPQLQTYQQELDDYIVEFRKYVQKLDLIKQNFFTSRSISRGYQQIIENLNTKNEIRHFINHSSLGWNDFAQLKEIDIRVAQAHAYLQYLEGCQNALYERIRTLETQQESATQATQASQPSEQIQQHLQNQQELQQSVTLTPAYQQQLEQTKQTLLNLPVEHQNTMTKQLLDSIERTLTEQGVHYDAHSSLTPQATTALAENNIPLEKFENITGNAFQLQVAQHSIEQIERAAVLRAQCTPDDIGILNACDASINFADAAFDMVSTPAHPDTIVTLNQTSSALCAIGECLREVGNIGFRVADDSRRILQGEVVGTAKAAINCATGLAHLIAHPQETIHTLECNLNKLEWFLGRLLREEPTAIQQTRNLCQAFLKLPLEKQSELVTELVMSFYLPGKMISGLGSLANHPSVARAFTNLGRLAAQELPILKAALGAELRWHIEATELVNFGGRIMASELRDQIVRWGEAIQSSLSDAELVERAAKLMPITRACTRAAQEFIRDAMPETVQSGPGLVAARVVSKEAELIKNGNYYIAQTSKATNAVTVEELITRNGNVERIVNYKIINLNDDFKIIGGQKVPIKKYLESLMRDSAKGDQITWKTIDEALAGFVAEQQNAIKGPLVRDPSGAGEFIDVLGQVWDVKLGISRAPNGKSIFQLDNFVGKIKREILVGENLILDLRYLEKTDLYKLIKKLTTDFSKEEFARMIAVI